MRRRGFTLIEILIALILSLIAISIAYIMLKDEHSNFVRVRSRIRMQSDAREAMNILEYDLRNLGLKRANLYSKRDMSVIDCPDARISASDPSSFLHVNSSSLSSPGDEITFALYPPDESGMVTCHSTNLLFVRYRLGADSVLTRATASSQSAISTAPDIPLLENVLAFQIQYGIQVPDTVLWDSTSIWHGTGSLSASGSASAGWTSSGWGIGLQYLWTPKTRTIRAGSRLQASFRITPNLDMADTSNGRPYLVIGFLDGGVLKDTVPFTVGDDAGRTIVLDIVPRQDMAAANLVVGGRLKSATAAPNLRMTSLQVREVSSPSYTWIDDPTTLQKSQIRAVRVFLLPRSREKSLPSKQNPWTGIGDLPSFDPGASLGGKAASLFVRTIPVVNNGH